MVEFHFQDQNEVQAWFAYVQAAAAAGKVPEGGIGAIMADADAVIMGIRRRAERLQARMMLTGGGHAN